MFIVLIYVARHTFFSFNATKKGTSLPPVRKERPIAGIVKGRLSLSSPKITNLGTREKIENAGLLRDLMRNGLAKEKEAGQSRFGMDAASTGKRDYG
jgi:hypothetical protein